MKYIYLKDNFALRGWDKLPYAVVNLQTGTPVFLNKEQFEAVKLCDGTLESLSLPGFYDFQRMGIEHGFLEEREEKNGGFKPYQKYKKAECRYVKSIQWSITGKCNLNCRHCYVSAPDSLHGELSFNDCLNIINQFEAANIAEVTITGGEPLVRKDFWDIIDVLIEKRFALNSLFTNGLLVTDEFLRECKKRNLKWTFWLSFDGVGCHDWLRGTNGVESKTAKAIERIVKAGYPVAISTALHSNNLASLTDTFYLLKSLGIEIWKTSGVIDTGNWQNETDKKFIEPKVLYDAYLNLISLYRTEKMPMSLMLGGFYFNRKESNEWSSPYEKFSGTEKALNMTICGACRNNLYLLPDGKVIPCMPMCGTSIEMQADNIFQTPLTDILNESSGLFTVINTRLRELHEKNKICGNCEFRLKCGGCRAVALQNENSIYGIDKMACYYFKNNYRSKIEMIVKT